MPQSELNLNDAQDLENEWPGQALDLRRIIPDICDEWFPDDEGTTWNIERMAHVGDWAFVLVRPEPGDVGYNLILVLVGFSPRSSEFPAYAMYVQDQESKFGLLASDSDSPEDIPSAIVW
jgi:hypothetical protein